MGGAAGQRIHRGATTVWCATLEETVSDARCWNIRCEAATSIYSDRNETAVAILQ